MRWSRVPSARRRPVPRMVASKSSRGRRSTSPVVYACTGSAERSIVVLRRAGKATVLSTRPVLLSAKYKKPIVVTAPGQHAARYRVTIGLGDVSVSVVVRVRPFGEPVRID